MAKMIPPSISPDVKSSAERRLFPILRDMEDTDSWTVLYSVQIANHPTQIQGEADFVVIIPDKGIFVLEVKGGRISYHDGVWQSKDRNEVVHGLKNGPVVEANEAMHAFDNYIRLNTPPIDPASHTLFGFGVVFPDSDMHGVFSVPDLDDRQIADYSDMSDMRSYLLKLAEYWKSKMPRFIEAPDVTTCNKIVKLLRPFFDSHVSAVHQINSVEKQILTLTENQMYILDGLRKNDRCLVIGSAGTGKTVLAVNRARELSEQGESVAFFCYNKQLAVYLRQNTHEDKFGYCGSLTEYMLEIVQQYSDDKIEPEKMDDKDLFYKKTLPSLFVDCFIDNELSRFDYIIIDEAQDLMMEEYLDVLELILKDGLDEGRWYMFMDADKQNVFQNGVSYDDIETLLKKHRIFYAIYELENNCRNSISIIEKIDELFGSDTHYPAAEEKGAPVEISVYKKDKYQARTIIDTVNKLLSEGVDPEIITILSPFRFENSAVSQITDEIPVSDKHEKGHIFFSTIDAYKGMENSVVIVTDIDHIYNEKDVSRMYIAMTRAKSRLFLVLSRNANMNLGKLKEKTNE